MRRECSSIAAPEPTISPTLWVDFNNNVIDNSPNNYTPLVTGTIEYYNNQYVGKTNTYVRYNIDKFCGTDDFRLDLTFTPTASGNGIILSATPQNSTTGFAQTTVGLENGSLQLSVRESNGTSYPNTTYTLISNIVVNTTYNISLQRISGVLYVYNYGQLVTSFAMTKSCFNNVVNYITIGNFAIYHPDSNYFRGYIDEIKYWHNWAQGPSYLMDVRLNGTTVYDYTTQQNYQWGTAVDSEWFTNGNQTLQSFFVPFGQNTWKTLYINNQINWNTSTPNPPTNGVCPEYYGFGLRFKMLYYSTTNSHDKTVFSTMSHNNTQYRGYTAIYSTGYDGWVWCEYLNSHASAANYWKFNFTPDSSTNYAILQWDFDHTYNRFKIFDSNNVLKIDTGLRTSLHNHERVLQLMCGNWNGNMNPTSYFKYIQLIDGRSVSDFLQ